MGSVGLEVLGSGEYVPTRRVASLDFDRRWGRPAGWTEAQTGVGSRAWVAGGENVLTMGEAAAREALDEAGIAAGDLDAVVACGSVPAQAIPCTAAFLHRALGLTQGPAAAFDINATCLGFVAALDLLAQSIGSGRYRHVLVVASEVASAGLDPQDAPNAALFGDGAAAVVLGPARGSGALLVSRMQTFSAGVEHCQVRAGGTLLDARGDRAAHEAGTYFRMRGRDTYRLAAAVLPGFLQDLLARAGLRVADIDHWLTHQASGRALQHLQQHLQLPAERFVNVLATHGNQIAASLPVVLHRARRSGVLRTGQHLALLGSGAGLSIGGAVLRV